MSYCLKHNRRQRKVDQQGNVHVKNIIERPERGKVPVREFVITDGERVEHNMFLKINDPRLQQCIDLAQLADKPMKVFLRLRYMDIDDECFKYVK